ncbi:hypothetical protein C8Z91_23125 [Paenibacillus elgii]|uniref:Uncharacterized protein n=1 Tax=Paenibacillus elgii TaxID=189691 RepID=A0A2T6FYE8_9BACL|nr:hypothetical protein C8Z91_23125 [Paenibacillus elgii]
MLMEDGTVKSWGYNSSGQLGLGDLLNRVNPTTINFSVPTSNEKRFEYFYMDHIKYRRDFIFDENGNLINVTITLIEAGSRN